MHRPDIIPRCIVRNVIDEFIEEGRFENLIVGKQLQSRDRCTLEACRKWPIRKSASSFFFDTDELSEIRIGKAIR